MDIVRLDTLMRDNLVCLVIFIIFLYVYTDLIVDITPQFITLNQRSKSDNYHKNKYSST
jgi:cytochrome c oxidase assembly factor CtaG